MSTRHPIYISIKGSSNSKEYFLIKNTPKRKNTSKGCQFPEFSVNSNKIGEESSNLKFEFIECKKNGDEKTIGELEITLISLYNNNSNRINIFRNAFVVGKLIPVLTKDSHNNFLKYIYDGFCLKLLVAVDFCSVNKGFDPEAQPPDLQSSDIREQYKEAIMEIGTLLKYYDDDERTVGLGFGAKLPPYFNVVSHCFALNGNYFEPTVKSLEELCNYIDEDVKKLQLHGPRIVSESIKYAQQLASHNKQEANKQYIVLLIVTNGNVSDSELTKQLLKDCSSLPMSVIAVQIIDKLDAAFEDSKTKLEDIRSLKMKDPLQEREFDVKRKIFRHIKYSEVRNNLDNIATATFKEIPQQFIEYMLEMGINPKKQGDAKGTVSKRDIKKKIENRKKRNISKPHSVQEYMVSEREQFMSEVYKVYSRDIIDQVSSTLQAKEFNLLAELVAEEEKKINQKKNQPISLKNAEMEMMALQGTEDEEIGLPKTVSKPKPLPVSSRLPPKTKPTASRGGNITHETTNPKTMKLYTKDKIPDYKFKEWTTKKNEAYMATQEMLNKAEQQEATFWEKHLPEAIISQYRNKKEKVEKKEEKEVELWLDKAEKLESYLDDQKVKFDENYGSKTMQDNLCLFCRTNPISIVGSG